MLLWNSATRWFLLLWALLAVVPSAALSNNLFATVPSTTKEDWTLTVYTKGKSRNYILKIDVPWFGPRLRSSGLACGVTKPQSVRLSWESRFYEHLDAIGAALVSPDQHRRRALRMCRIKADSAVHRDIEEC